MRTTAADLAWKQVTKNANKGKCVRPTCPKGTLPHPMHGPGK